MLTETGARPLGLPSYTYVEGGTVVYCPYDDAAQGLCSPVSEPPKDPRHRPGRKCGERIGQELNPAWCGCQPVEYFDGAPDPSEWRVRAMQPADEQRQRAWGCVKDDFAFWDQYPRPTSAKHAQQVLEQAWADWRKTAKQPKGAMRQAFGTATAQKFSAHAGDPFGAVETFVATIPGGWLTLAGLGGFIGFAVWYRRRRKTAQKTK